MGLRSGALPRLGPRGHSGPPRGAISSPQMDAGDDLRAGLEGVPSRDHAEPQSAWPLEPATRFWSIASKNLPRRHGPREGTPSNPTLSLWHRPPRSKTARPHPRIRTYLIDGCAWVDQRKWKRGRRRRAGPAVHRGGEVGGGGGLPPRSRIFWGASSKRETNISWRARVAPRVAAQRAPRRQPPPRPPLIT